MPTVSSASKPPVVEFGVQVAIWYVTPSEKMPSLVGSVGFWPFAAYCDVV